MIKTVKIPEDRVAVLIGRHGKVKREVEEYTKTKLAISDVVDIEGEPIDAMTAENVIRAIGRGFSPEKALDLLDEENALLVIALNPKSAGRIKSRIIGTNGKTRYKIEKMTKTFISVYGRTVSIIGRYHDVELAKEAVEKIIEGATHKFVYDFLEKKLQKKYSTM